MRLPMRPGPSRADSSAMPESPFAEVGRSLQTEDREPANQVGPVTASTTRTTAARRPEAGSSAASDEARAHPVPRPDVLTVDELAELLRLERKTVYACISRGEIPGVRRLGGAIRVHRDAVLGWLAEGQGRTPRLRGHK